MRTKLSMLLLILVWVAGCATPQQSATPEATGPKPDARFQVTTTSISRGMGLSWGDGRLGDNYIDYKFQMKALTLNEWNDRFAMSGQQVTLYGNVYHMKEVADFAGTYRAATPEVTRSVGGSENSRVYQNDKGVLMRVTGRYVGGPLGLEDTFDVRLLNNDFTVTLREF